MNQRINTRIMEDAGDVIRDVNLVDVSASETLAAAEHDPTGTVAWRPALASTDYYQFLVKTRDKTAGGHVTTHQLETILGRLNRTYPPAVLATAHTISRSIFPSNPPTSTVTLSTAMEYLLRQWQATLPGLDWEALPPLTVQTSSGTITPVVEALAIRQEGNPRSARQILDELLNLFTGYILRATPTGKLQVVPPPSGPSTLTLTSSKIVTIDRATTFDDVVNKATVSSRHWAYEPADLSYSITASASSAYQPAIDGVTGPGQRTGFEHLGTRIEGHPDAEDTFRVPTPPGVLPGFRWFADIRYDLSGRTWDDGDEAWNTLFTRNQDFTGYQEILVRELSEAGTTALLVEPLEKPLRSGEVISLPGLAGMSVSGNHAKGATSISVNSISADIPRGTIIPHSWISMTQTSTAWGVPILDGDAGDPADGPIAWLHFGQDSNGFFVRWEQLRLTGPPHPTTPGIDHIYQVGIRVAVTFKGWNWVQTNTNVEATFGDATNPGQVSDLPGFVDSQGDFGIIERTLPAGFVNLNVDDSLAIAQAYVRANMHPRERVTLEVTPDLPIKPSDINKLVHVAPLGAEAVIESWEHTEMFDNTSASVTTRVTGVLTGDAEPVDPGLMSFSRAFDRSFAGGLHSPQRPWWEE